MNQKELIKKVCLKLGLDNRIKAEVLKLKNLLNKLAQEKNFETYNMTLINLAKKLGVLNHQDKFGDMLQEVSDWKLDLSTDYKKNLVALGKRYNVLGLNFRH